MRLRHAYLQKGGPGNRQGYTRHGHVRNSSLKLRNSYLHNQILYCSSAPVLTPRDTARDEFELTIISKQAMGREGSPQVFCLR
jgi:hypothetical protein